MAMVTGVGQPIDLIAYGCVPGYIVMLSLNHGMTPNGYAQAPPIIQQLTGLALSWACLPTQLLAPDSVNMVSLILPKLSPYPRDSLCRRGWPNWGLSLPLL